MHSTLAATESGDVFFASPRDRLDSLRLGSVELRFAFEPFLYSYVCERVAARSEMGARTRSGLPPIEVVMVKAISQPWKATVRLSESLTSAGTTSQPVCARFCAASELGSRVSARTRYSRLEAAIAWIVEPPWTPVAPTTAKSGALGFLDTTIVVAEDKEKEKKRQREEPHRCCRRSRRPIVPIADTTLCGQQRKGQAAHLR